MNLKYDLTILSVSEIELNSNYFGVMYEEISWAKCCLNLKYDLTVLSVSEIELSLYLRKFKFNECLHAESILWES